MTHAPEHPTSTTTTTNPTPDAEAPAVAAVPGVVAVTPADRFMRRLLRIPDTQTTNRGAVTGAHRAFRVSLVISGIRCLISYLLVPILVPILSIAGVIAAPLGIVLCAFAVINGIISVRRFWRAHHPARWMYTGFIGIVFIVLAVALTADITRLATPA